MNYHSERNYCLVPNCDEQPEVNGELCWTHSANQRNEDSVIEKFCKNCRKITYWIYRNDKWICEYCLKSK